MKHTFEELFDKVKHLQDTFSIAPFECKRMMDIPDETMTVLEIGSHKGFSTAFLANSGAKVTSVDNCLDVPVHVRTNLFKSLGFDNIECISQDSQSYLIESCREARRFDMIFHDAAHGHGVMHEYVMAVALVNVGGMLIIHDWDQIQVKQRHLIYDLFSGGFKHNYHCEITKDNKGRETLYLY